MRVAIGAIILLLGVMAFGSAVSNMPLGAGLEFMLGYFSPSAAITMLGFVILAWNKRGQKELRK